MTSPGKIVAAPFRPHGEVNSRPRMQRIFRTLLLCGLSALLIFGPLALGVVSGWSIAILEGGAAIPMLIWTASQAASNDCKIEWSPLFAPMLAFFAVVLAQIAFNRTAYRYDSISELSLYVAYGFLVFVTVQLSPHSGFSRFGQVMALFGSVYALFAVVQGITSSDKIYWRLTPLTGRVYGSYINHNHYAGLIEMLFPLALISGFTGRSRTGTKVLQVSAAALMAASIFLCQSRGGMIALGVETLFLAVVWARHFSARKFVAAGLVFCSATVLLLGLIAPESVRERVTNIHDPARLLILRDTVPMFLAHPILGSGFGTFATAFPHYRVFFDGFVVDHAHNDYVELLLDTGLVGFGIAMWFLVILYREGLRNARLARFSQPAAMSIAALAGCTGLLAHSFLDFNLHIPGNAAVFYVLCAVAASRHNR